MDELQWEVRQQAHPSCMRMDFDVGSKLLDTLYHALAAFEWIYFEGSVHKKRVPSPPKNIDFHFLDS
jgi:hypothetical protein